MIVKPSPTIKGTPVVIQNATIPVNVLARDQMIAANNLLDKSITDETGSVSIKKPSSPNKFL